MAIVLSALSDIGVPAFYDQGEMVVLAHPAGTSRNHVVTGEHVTITVLGDRTVKATAWKPGSPDYHPIADVYESPAGETTLAQEAAQSAAAVAQWFTEPRPTAGGVLLAALAEHGITHVADHRGMSYAVPVDPDTQSADAYNGPHLSIADRSASVDHVPAAHTGWSIFTHDRNGEPVGDPIYIAGDGRVLDCHADSRAAAAFVAAYLAR
ncbi:hypothetical protein [Streptomyces rubradiris]|uniref:hypothetical protein n=1 Tax=Streptomyces rubradiris TaxID=285531 RepID=UPI0016727A02|nr:hypothetical protein [Streptomyces rubradiris]